MNSTKNITLSRSTISPVGMIFIIDCLRDSDLQNSRRREEGMLDKLNSIYLDSEFDSRNHVKHLRCNSVDDFHNNFLYIQNLCKKGCKPLIFIDGHGSKENGLELPSGKFINWKILLLELNAITTITLGELTVIAAFCYSMEVIDLLDKNSLLPFAFYYGYDSEVSAGAIEDETKLMYESMLQHGITFIDHKPQYIKCYSEYDHVDEFIAVVYLLAKDPRELSSELPELSMNATIRQVEIGLASDGVPLSSMNKLIKSMIRNGSVLAELIKERMHNTPRRQILLRELADLFNNSDTNQV